jgi:hypothetical protein
MQLNKYSRFFLFLWASALIGMLVSLGLSVKMQRMEYQQRMEEQAENYLRATGNLNIEPTEDSR